MSAYVWGHYIMVCVCVCARVRNSPPSTSTLEVQLTFRGREDGCLWLLWLLQGAITTSLMSASNLCVCGLLHCLNLQSFTADHGGFIGGHFPFAIRVASSTSLFSQQFS